jgi:TP901 family phage tail tape measure protein
MAALRELLVSFGIEVNTKPLEEANAKTNGLVDKISKVAGAVAAAFALDKVSDFVLGMVSAADAVGDQAARLNLSSKELEQWTYQAKFADLEASELNGVFDKLARTSVAGADATSEQGKALKALGVDVRAVGGGFKDTSQLFEEVGLALAGVDDETQRTAMSFDFFGKTAGPKVLQMFKDGPAGIAKFRAEFEELGGGFGEFVEEAGAVDDQMHRFDLAWTGAKTKIVGLVMPAVMWITRGLTTLAVGIAKVAKETYLFEAAFGVVAAAAVAYAAPIIAAWAPIALAVALVVLAVEDLITMFRGGDSVIGRTLDKLFGPGSAKKLVKWTKDVGEAFGTFFGDLINRPHQFEENWARTSAAIKNDIRNALGPAFGEFGVSVYEASGVMLSVLTDGWQVFSERFSAIIDGVGFAFRTAWTEMKFFGLGVVAELADAVEGMVAKLPDSVRGALGLGTAADSGGSAVGRVDKEKLAAFANLMAEGTLIQARISAPAHAAPAYGAGLIGPPAPAGGTPVQQTTTITIHGADLSNPYQTGQAVKRALGRPNAAAGGSLDRRGRK